ncbi:hypothetical protein ACFU9B_43185 [Streptomyces sp. NPDC057592]|uniref:hypothetical protein n=1 Tax=unclassified Streptomyces TaxID=2593676 RepID=UPI003693A43B
MNITVTGRGRVGGGLAQLWETASHKTGTLGRGGGDVPAADVFVAGGPIGGALHGVTGRNGQVTIGTTNLDTERDAVFPSLAHQVKSVVGGPTAKPFNAVFASSYEPIGAQRVTPSNLSAAELDAMDATARLIGDTGFDPCVWETSIPGHDYSRTFPASHERRPARSARSSSATAGPANCRPRALSLLKLLGVPKHDERADQLTGRHGLSAALSPRKAEDHAVVRAGIEGTGPAERAPEGLMRMRWCRCLHDRSGPGSL